MGTAQPRVVSPITASIALATQLLDQGVELVLDDDGAGTDLHEAQPAGL